VESFALKQTFNLALIQLSLHGIQFSLVNVDFVLQVFSFLFVENTCARSVVGESLLTIIEQTFKLFGAASSTGQNLFALQVTESPVSVCEQATPESHSKQRKAYRGFAISPIGKREANQSQEAKDEQRPKVLELSRLHPCLRSTIGNK
jgi:hypothetical protein